MTAEWKKRVFAFSETITAIARQFVGKSQFQATVVGLSESGLSDETVGFVDGNVERFRICGCVGFFSLTAGQDAFQSISSSWQSGCILDICFECQFTCEEKWS
jgi:hypothetical protein